MKIGGSGAMGIWGYGAGRQMVFAGWELSLEVFHDG